jgi:hypothetical protein
MIDFEYLHKGISGLANAHKAGTMAGHLGAAVVAGYFFGEDQAGLPQEVFKGIEGELQRIIRGEEAIWFNVKKVGLTPSDLFKPLPKGPPKKAAIPSIAAALKKNVGQTRQSGHNTIFASLALRALHDHADYAALPVVAGVRKLIEGFNNAHAGRGYYGKATGWRTGRQVKLPPAGGFKMYRNVQDMATVTISELIATASIRKQGFGGMWHIINHAAAITELERLGYKDLARQALPAHHQHVRLWRTLPDVEKELGPLTKSKHDPRQPAYWKGMLKRDQARLTHRIKTLFGFFVLKRFVEDKSTLKKAEEAFLYLMA